MRSGCFREPGLDLRRLKDFLARNNPRAAREAAHTIEAAVRSLAVFPHRGRASDISGLRELTVRYGRDGYVVRYRVESKLVLVTRIYHGLEQR